MTTPGSREFIRGIAHLCMEIWFMSTMHENLGSICALIGWYMLANETISMVLFQCRLHLNTDKEGFALSYRCPLTPLFRCSHHHVVPPARISLTLSRHFSLSFIASGRSSGLHPVSSHSCCMQVRAGRPAFAHPYVGVHRSTSLMSSSLLLQQCPAFAVVLELNIFGRREGKKIWRLYIEFYYLILPKIWMYLDI